MKKKIISLVIALCAVVVMLPVMGMAKVGYLDLAVVKTPDGNRYVENHISIAEGIACL